MMTLPRTFLAAAVFPWIHLMSMAQAAPLLSDTPAISRPIGQGALFLGGGSALTTDLSAVDLNPAGIGVGKVFRIEGATSWKGENIQSSEAGIIDSKMADVAAAIKFRQTSDRIALKERRFSLALADEVAQSGLIIGLAGDYKERPIRNSENLITSEGEFFELRAGAIYSLTERFRVAAHSEGHFDDQRVARHTVGIGASVSSQFTVGADAIFRKSTLEKLTTTAGIAFQKYFDLRAAYGYLLETEAHQLSGGAFLNSPKASLFYLAKSEDIGQAVLEHQIGLSFALAL